MKSRRQCLETVIINFDSTNFNKWATVMGILHRIK